MAKKIMIVDDEAAVVYVVKLVLEHLGIRGHGSVQWRGVSGQDKRGETRLLYSRMSQCRVYGGVLGKIKENEELRAILIVMLPLKPLNAEALKRREIKDITDYITTPFSI